MMRDKRLLVFTAIALGASMSACSIPGISSSSGSSDTTAATSASSTATAEDLVSTSSSKLDLDLDTEDTVTSWDASTSTSITLNGTSASASGSGVTISGSTVTITSAGTYVISGTLQDGSIVINTTDKGTVRLIFNGVTISSSSTAPVCVTEAKKVLITLADGTTNTVTDSARSSAAEEDYSAAIYSKSDLVFNGSGSLTVNAGYRNGIKSTDDLKIVSGTYNVTAAEDGIIGKDLLGIAGGTFTITSGSDGMKSTYDTDTSKGNVVINGGTFTITSGTDGIQAENILLINDGTFTIKTGKTSSGATVKTGDSMGMTSRTTSTTAASSTESTKGLKATNAIYIYNGSYNIDSQDDSVHSNGTISISGGNLQISSGDDGMHADKELTINSGTVSVNTSYEGLESAVITINGGDIQVVSSDDGVNASDGSSTSTAGGFGFGQQQSSSSSSSSVSLTINGGSIFVNATGDGLDSNGTLTINGGTTIVEGPTANDNAAIDYDSNFVITGGTIMAFGSSGMLETPKSVSNEYAIVDVFSSVTAGSTFTVKDSSGNTVMTYTPSKTYASAIIASADLTKGSSYTLTAGSSSQTATISDSITTIGTSSSSGGMGAGGAAPGGSSGNSGRR